MIFLSDIENSVRKATSSSYDSVRCAITLLDGVGAVVAQIADVYSRVIDGYHEFPGVEELVRAHMQNNNLSVITPNVSFYYYLDGDVISAPERQSYDIIYTGAKLITNPANQTADQLLTKRFLFQSACIWLLPGQSIRIPYYNTTENLTMSVHREYRDGSNDSNFTVGVDDTGLSYYNCNYNANYLYERFTFGDRSLEIYYLKDEFAEHFKFRNVFNIEQLVGFAASIEMDPSEEHEEAYQDKVLKAYDRDQKLEVKVATAALPSFMYDSLLALCRASAVQYKEDGTWYDIIITKYKLDKPSKPSTPIRLELTFEFANTDRLEVIRY